MHKSHLKINALVLLLVIFTALIPQPGFDKNIGLIIFFYLSVLLFSIVEMKKDIETLDILLLVFIGIVTIGVFFNSSDIVIAERRFFLTYVPLAILFLIAKNQKEETYTLAIKSITAACLLISIFMIYEFFTGKNFVFSHIVQNVYFEHKGFYGNRAFGIFYHPTVAGAFLTMIFPFIALFLSDKENKVRHIFGHISFIVVSIAIFLTFSKMAWLILGGMYLWYLWQK